jgi:hypothetical protein
MFAEQYAKATLRTDLSTMSSEVADEATARTKEEVGILVGQMG